MKIGALYVIPSISLGYSGVTLYQYSSGVRVKVELKKAEPSEQKDTSLFELGNLFNTYFR